MASVADEDEDDDDETEAFVPCDNKVRAKELKSGRLIGKGRSSIVYETTWKGRSYARKDFLRVPSVVFEREAAVLAALDEHPNVTRTHCWSVSEASCSLVVDLMDDDLQNVMRNRRESAWQKSPSPGGDDTSHVIDLHKFVEDEHPELRPVASALVSTFTISEALHIMLQIAEGIVFLHEHGVAHGDLKPKNILVAPSDEQQGRSLGFFHVKMADFGLVGTKMKSKALASQRARKLEIARWRAPELFDKSYLLGEDESFTDSDWDSDSGDHDGDVHTYGKLSRADVYSFAVTCAQILTGDLDPYSGLGLRELVSKISRPNGLRPGLPQRCPAQLSDLINRCWGDELKRPSFIGIRSELKDLQASLSSDSYVLDVRRTISWTPDFEVTVSVKYFSEKIAKKRFSELTSSNPAAPTIPTLPRCDLEITEAVGGVPLKADTFPVKSNDGTSKLTRVPKTRRRRKVHGCLGCVPVKTIRRNERDGIPALKKELGGTIGPKPFTFAEVTTMTRNFKAEIGRGGFGTVYFGKLPDGQQVAVKVGNSPQRKREFYNEIAILSRVRHKNLVALVGFCQENILIYEYMENGSLHDHLHGNRRKAGMLDWKKRLRIALNVAQGLEYLHTGCEQSFVHGDTKSSNVLLSSKYDAKVTDFGLTKPAGVASDAYTHVSTIIRGTRGYFDPEYFLTNNLSPKSDIYSFGVVLLELITGRRPVSPEIGTGTTWEPLPDWVRPALEKGDIDMVLDPALKSSVPAPNQEALWKVAELAIRCVEPKGEHRPKLSEVIHVLHQAMDLEGTLDESQTFTSRKSINVLELNYVEQNAISWNSDSFTESKPIEKPSFLDSPSTKVTYIVHKGRLRRRAFNFFDRLGFIPAKFGNIMEKEFPPSFKGNDRVTASTKLPLSSDHGGMTFWGKSRKSTYENVQDIGTARGAKSYTYAEVAAITSNFKSEIGRGGFGPVYYGQLPSGKEVAVKVGEASNSSQGSQEFFNEIDLLSRVHHRNLVSLLGYCAEKQRNILIYEYMENGSLTDHLRGNRMRTGMLDWKKRLQIALNVAQGLEYLHTGCNPRIIHRDVKSSNVLLSADYDAKVTDFGLSRAMGVGVSTSPVTTMVMGTAGYIDPEYLITHFLTAKSDVYGFGVVLLELMTGHPPFDSSKSPRFSLLDWARTALQDGDIDMILDSVLKSSVPAANQEALWKVAELAMRCVEAKGVHRPTIDEAVQELRAAMVLEEALPLPSEYSSYDPEIVSEISSPLHLR